MKDEDDNQSPEMIEAMEEFLKAPSLEAFKCLRIRLEEMKPDVTYRLCNLASERRMTDNIGNCLICPLYDETKSRGLGSGDLCDFFYEDWPASWPPLKVDDFWEECQGLVVLNITRFVNLLEEDEDGHF